MAGFRPLQNQSGGDYTGKVTQYSIASTHASRIAVGDLVLLTGTADANGVAQVDRCTANPAASLLVGPIVGFLPNFSNLEQSGLPIGTGGTVLVADDPATLMEVSVSNGTIALANVGLNADLAPGTTAATGLAISTMTLNAGTDAATATLPIRIVGIKNGDLTAAQKIFVRMNNPNLKNTLGV